MIEQYEEAFVWKSWQAICKADLTPLEPLEFLFTEGKDERHL